MYDFREQMFSHDENLFRASTLKQDFYFDIDPDETFKAIQISYAQNDVVLIQKTKDDLTFMESTDDNEEPVFVATLTLSQEETSRFSLKNSRYVYLQVRALTYGGEAIAFDKIQLLLKDVLDDKVLE